MRFVTALLESEGWRVQSVETENRGFDLIARKPHPEDPKTAIDVRFVEVKEKRRPAYGEPVEAVTPEKQRRVRRAADTWLAARPELDSLSVAFDVVAVREGRLERLGDAF